MTAVVLKRLKPIAVPAAALLLLLMAVAPALASPSFQETRAKQGLFGTLKARGENTIEVQTSDGGTVELAITERTQFRVPGEAEADLWAIPEGSRVAILAEGDAEAMTALKVMLVPGQPKRQHRVLTVVDVSGNVVVAEDNEGNRIEVELDHSISDDIKGQLIIFVGTRSQQPNRFKANAQVKIEQVVDRLQAHARELDAEVRAEHRADARATKERQLAQLQVRLEATMKRHLDVFTEVIAKAPESAKAPLEAALQMTLKGYEAALEALGHAEGSLEARLDLHSVRGSVTSVDHDSSTLTISSQAGATLTLRVTEETTIKVGGEAGTLADISAGDRVGVRYNRDTSVAIEIHVATQAEARGIIRGFGDGQIVIETPGGEALTLLISSDTRVEVNGMAASTSDLKVGAQVKVEYDTRTMMAVKVRAETEARAHGTVESVNTVEGTVAIVTDDGEKVVVRVIRGTRVDVQGRVSGLGGLASGMRVEVRYNPDTGIATEVRARATPSASATARVAGKVSGVRVASGAIAVELESGRTVTLNTDSSTRITVNGTPAGIEDIQVGAHVRAEYRSDTMTASLIEVEVRTETRPGTPASASVSGSLSAVSVVDGAVTVTTERGAEMALRLASDTRILLNGASATIADLAAHVGSQVSVQYNTATNVASAVIVRSQTQAQADASATVSGTLESVNVLTGTVTILADTGATVTLNITRQSQISLDGAASGIAALAAAVGSRVTAAYDVNTRAVISLRVQG